GDFVGQVASFYQTGDETLISDDRSAMIVPVFVENEEASAASYVERIEEKNGVDGFTVATGGEHSVTLAFEETSESDLLTGETIGISVALLVLVIVFGTLVSAGVPLMLAVVSITIAIGMTLVIGNVWELSIFVTNMIVMIGLAVGIDYTLFIVGRYREERAKGIENREAIIRAGDTATKAVLFSGITVVIALLGMLLVPSTIFVSLGTGAILVVLAAIAGTLTLLPAVLSLLAGKVHRGTGRALTGVIAVALFGFAALFQFVLGVHPAFPIIYVLLGIGMLIATALDVDPFHTRESTGENSFWDRITRFVMAHPGALVSVTTVALLVVGLVYFTIKTGQSGITTLPEDTSARQAFAILSEEFSGVSLEEPNTVVVQADDVNNTEIQAAVDELTASVANDGDFGPATVQVNDKGDLLAVSFPSTSDVQSGTSLSAVERLREEYVPQAFGGLNEDALVTGPTAFTLDFNSVVDDYTPIVFAFVLGMSFFLLLLAFRSIVVPIKSILMNLLSVGASYGLLVAIFQHGIGNELFGFQQVDRIDAWIPLMMFTILFGLSMDYHVFLLSRIKEHYDATGNNTEAVAYGLRTTASIITGAALIMVAVFGGFAMGELSMFQQMGFGLATAVILDATVVRTVLVPAGMKLLREYNWYFPNWLNWLPKINVEGIPQAETQQPSVEGVTAD
ncbi:MAG: MMPL family transporter, partial [Chloroflexota bacterium]